MSGGSPFWTPERVEQLTALYAEGLSFSQIARIMGGITRNACISKAKRMGIGPAPAKARKSRAKTGLPALTEPAPPKPLPAPEPTPVTAVTTLELQQGQCKFPLNDGAPRWLHCGAVAEGGPYCEHHRRRSIGGGTRAEKDAA